MSELPQGWEWTTVKEIAESMQNGIYKQSHFYNSDGVACLRMYNIEDGRIVWKNIKRMNLTKTEVSQYELKPGDILVNRVNSRELVGKSAPILANLETCVYESKNIRLRLLSEYVESTFVAAWLNIYSQRYFNDNAQQTVGMASINQEQLGSMPLTLPPLNEQRRIVAKLEKLLAKCEASKQRLDKIPSILKRFRQSILAAACSGRLTADWREQNPDVEPASELLKRIREKRQKSHEKKCEKAKEKGARKPKEPFEDYSTIKLENREELPLSWCITLFGNLTETQGGIQKTSKRTPGDNPYPYLRVANVYRGYLKLNEIEYFELFENDLATWKLEKNDLLIVEGNGSPTEIGRCAIWDGSIEDCVHQNHIIRSRPLSGIEASFLLTYLNSPQGMEVMTQLASSTSGLHTLSVSKVNNIIVPLAPIEEQKEIVQRVGKLFKLAGPDRTTLPKSQSLRRSTAPIHPRQSLPG
jgi:type I restriction enzyme, S subunit